MSDLCACGCGESLPYGHHAATRYLNAAHQHRGYNAGLRVRAKERRPPSYQVSLILQPAELDQVRSAAKRAELSITQWVTELVRDSLQFEA